MTWNPDQYEKFKAERYAPFEDLIQLVNVREGMDVIDLGCGTGELTRRLADMLPNSTTVGLDSSEEMLARSAERVREGLTFRTGAIEDVEGEFDLVFSNAAIQWVDDHERLVSRLLSLVRSGGQLVVQLPSNHGSIAHRLITELAAQEPFKSALKGWSRQTAVLPVERYAELLFDNGGQEITAFEKVYPHVLDSAADVAEWTRGTALVPYMERLGEEWSDRFLDVYRKRLNDHWPQRPVFYGFRRILFAATRN